MSSPLEADKELAAALGRMTGAWAHIEMLLTILFTKITAMPFGLAAGVFDLFRNTQMQQKVLSRTAALAELPAPIRKALDEALSTFVALANKRNELAHNPFGYSDPDSNSGTYLMLKTQGKPGPNGIPYATRPITVDEIDKVTEEIKACRLMFIGVLDLRAF